MFFIHNNATKSLLFISNARHNKQTKTNENKRKMQIRRYSRNKHIGKIIIIVHKQKKPTKNKQKNKNAYAKLKTRKLPLPNRVVIYKHKYLARNTLSNNKNGQYRACRKLINKQNKQNIYISTTQSHQPKILKI